MEKSARRLLVVRHGERCDLTFSHQGINWMEQAFDTNGRYHPFDLNLPRNLPKRNDGFEMFASDTPLTEMGYLQSKLTGRALRDHGVKVDHVYCSAALRCVQTAVGIIKGMDSCTLKINVEPGLYEWMYWCRNSIPSWMTPEELNRLGYPINSYYIPLLKPNDLCINETLNDFYERSFALVRKILSIHSEGTVLLVTHGPSVDALTRQLCETPFSQCEREVVMLMWLNVILMLGVIWVITCNKDAIHRLSFQTLFGPLIGEAGDRSSRRRHGWNNSDRWPRSGGPAGPPRGGYGTDRRPIGRPTFSSGMSCPPMAGGS
ncbi:unnamed protein product [Onchocerca flexuosa]|uniref:Phosphoglycerate mutase family protein n=1 Tax=Onchocerca flexuosa TaxID=387005 RepID=A0A183HZ02_9BILA|nr:unnamed protein product [Onchocerca flexuosa]